MLGSKSLDNKDMDEWGWAGVKGDKVEGYMIVENDVGGEWVKWES
jgi:hypothetical protein